MSERLQDYHYDFPEELIAQQPLAERDAARMLVLRRDPIETRHARFSQLSEWLQAGDLLVANNTAVQPCRLFARKATGGRIEIFSLQDLNDGQHRVWLSPARGLTVGQSLEIVSRSDGAPSGVAVEVISLENDDVRIRFASAEAGRRAFESFGEMPLPPYIDRDAPRPEDKHRYQTVFARQRGACAAPTAGLHFTPAAQQALLDRGISWTEITLHVGPGTFLPVKTENVADHVMHAEHYQVSGEAQEAIEGCRRAGGRIIAVGTTSLRAMESFAASGEARGSTRLFIRPGFEFKVASGLLTNFHQPRSTLLMLVSALAGRERILAAYREAIRERYRLFSYGDCMLIL